MNESVQGPLQYEVGTFVAALLVGAGGSTLVSGGSVALPVAGSAPGIAVGALGLVVGLGLLAAVRRSSSGCGCGGDCDC